MAHLGSLTTDKTLSFTKYVTNNKKLHTTKYEIESGKASKLFKYDCGAFIECSDVFAAGTSLSIISPLFCEINKVKYAIAQIDNITGLIPISKIRKPTCGNGTQYEDEVVDIINKVINEVGKPIDIKLKGDSVLYKSISCAVKVDAEMKQAAGVQGDPKADIVLCQDSSKVNVDSSIYISHKKDGGPKAFQQYGGISQTAGRVIYDNAIVQQFLGLVAQNMDVAGSLTQPIAASFDNTLLANQSVYGSDFGNCFSLNHVQVLGQGIPILKPINNNEYYELNFSSHMSLSGDLTALIGDYAPVLAATFRSSRSFKYKGKRYSGARVGIYPAKLIMGRSNLIKYNL